MTAAQLVEEIRRRHTSRPFEVCSRCRSCGHCASIWPCDAVRAADQIEALLARLDGLLDTIFDAGPREAAIAAAGPAPTEAT